MTERELIELAQSQLADLKKTLKQIQVVNTEANRPEAANAAFKTRAELDKWHAKAAKRLMDHFPELGGEIVIMGGGLR